MYYVGVDLHKKTAWFYLVDSKGNKLDSRNVPNGEEDLKNYLQKIPKPFILAVECTYNWYNFVDIAEQYANEVYLANSFELKAFAKRHKKTDKIDARLIAHVLRSGFLPIVTIADKKTREARELLRYRMNMVSDRTRNISRLKALLDKLGCKYCGDFTTYKGLSSIDTNGLPTIYVDVVKGYSERIMELGERIDKVEKEVECIVERDTDMSNLLTIPGIGSFSAALIKSEIIDIGRFKSFNRLCAYSGLAPRVSGSGEKIYHGQLNINRRKNLQWILLEIVFHYVRSSEKAQEKFKRIERTKGYNTAKVVLARDMLKIIYHVLKEKRAYYRSEVDYNNGRDKIQSVAAAALCGV